VRAQQGLDRARRLAQPVVRDAREEVVDDVAARVVVEPLEGAVAPVPVASAPRRWLQPAPRYQGMRASVWCRYVTTAAQTQKTSHGASQWRATTARPSCQAANASSATIAAHAATLRRTAGRSASRKSGPSASK